MYKYDVNIDIQGNSSHSFDAFGNLPDFSSSFYVNGSLINSYFESDSLTNSFIFSDIDIKKDDSLLLTVKDKDTFADDDIASIDFNFEGVDFLYDGYLVDVEFDFTQKEVTTKESYKVTVELIALESYEYDAFKTAPDFSGVLRVGNSSYSLSKEQNDYNPIYIFSDVLIDKGDKVSLKIFEEDSFFNDFISYNSFDFTNENREFLNEKITIKLSFERRL